MRVVYFGTPQFSAAFLSALLSDPRFDVVGVVCQPDEPVGRKKILTAPPTKILATLHKIPVFQPTKLRDEAFLASIDALHADVAVIVAYGRILPKILLDRIPKGFVNVHPSLLPQYRGPSPMQAAIAHQDVVTGVSIMTIDAGMDTGPLLAQASIPLAPDETTSSLTEKVIHVGTPLLIDSLQRYMDGLLTPKPQTAEDVSTCALLTKEDARIDWSQAADVIDAKIRAYTPWPGCWTMWNLRGTEIPVKILRSRTAQTPDSTEKSLVRSCGNGTFLELLEVHPSGSKPMSGAAFMNGYLKKSSKNA